VTVSGGGGTSDLASSTGAPGVSSASLASDAIIPDYDDHVDNDYDYNILSITDDNMAPKSASGSPEEKDAKSCKARLLHCIM
jgi:hypothetical protein